MIFYHSALSIKSEERRENEISFPDTYRFSDGMLVNAGTWFLQIFVVTPISEGLTTLTP
jgi:hypothetical protein